MDVAAKDDNIAAQNLMRIVAALKVEEGESFPKEQTFRDFLDRSLEVKADSE